MKIMVSACLLGQNCKYNGGNNYCDKVASFLEGHEVIPVSQVVNDAEGRGKTSRI